MTLFAKDSSSGFLVCAGLGTSPLSPPASGVRKPLHHPSYILAYYNHEQLLDGLTMRWKA